MKVKHVAFRLDAPGAVGGISARHRKVAGKRMSMVFIEWTYIWLCQLLVKRNKFG